MHAQGAALSRRTLVIAEIDANDPRWVRGRDVGGYGLDAHWSDDFHHAVHVALTGERTGYYADFADPGALAKVLGERYVNVAVVSLVTSGGADKSSVSGRESIVHV